MMEYNDMVTVVDRQDIELRGIEVLIKLVPFIERDVEERCAELEEDAQAMVALMEGMKDDNLGVYYAQKNEVFAKCERKKERENERLERLRRAILERAVRVFPELAAEEPQDSFRSVSGESGGTGASPHVRCTNYDLRCEDNGACGAGDRKENI